jgi:hypothetical protein
MEWNRKIEDKLTENWQWLLRTVMLKDIIHVLIEDKIISLDYWMNLKEKQISEQDRNANFFFEISKFTKERYRLFIEALKKGSHNHLADVLEIRQKEGRYTSVTTLYFLDYTCMVGKGFLKCDPFFKMYTLKN